MGWKVLNISWRGELQQLKKKMADEEEILQGVRRMENREENNHSQDKRNKLKKITEGIFCICA